MGSVVLRPLPVTQATMLSSLGMRPESISFLSTAMVTPPAVSVKMPSVRARSLMPSMISWSDAMSPLPPLSDTAFST